MESCTAIPSTLRNTLRKNFSPVVAEEPWNDDLERSKRRGSADIQRRLSHISVNAPGSGAKTEEEAKEHFELCSRMYIENKISVTNAWSLDILDIMRNILKTQTSAQGSLQLAATSLDVSSRIYACRVDGLYADGMKLASTMTTTNKPKDNNKSPDNGDDTDGGEGTNNDGEALRKRKKRLFSLSEKHTIATNPKSLLGNVMKLDTGCFQTRISTESSQISNLFTKQIPMHYGCYKFNLLSNKNAWVSQNAASSVLQEDNDRRFPFDVPNVSIFKICAPFADFKIDNWNLDHEEQIRKMIYDEVVYDEQGIPISELDGSVHDIFSEQGEHNENASSDEEGELNLEIAFGANDVHVTDFKLEDDSICFNDYLYLTTTSNKLMCQLWAGPSHWKLKHIRRSACRFSGLQEMEKVKPTKQKKIQAVPMDLDNSGPNIDFTKIYKQKRKPCNFGNRYMLPRNYGLEQKDTLLLMSKKCILRENVSKDVVENEVGRYNYENLNDSQYCSQHNEGDNGSDYNADEFPVEPFSQEQGIERGEQNNFIGENLVGAPELVTHSYLPYSLQAKKMDMKKLKAAVWKGLVYDQEGVQDMASGDAKTQEIKPTLFSDVYKRVPHYLPPRMNKELTSPLAFVALLHLATENNLQLARQDDLKDFQINKPKGN